MKTDYLVIGSGVAGLTFALKAARRGRVVVVTKGEIDESNTNYAQGGICSVSSSPDTFESHIEDTMVCGAGKCNRDVVEMVVKQAPERIKELIEWGTRFNLDKDGNYELHREGGHSQNRILHYKDLTGAEIQRALVEAVRKDPNIEIYEQHYAIDLLTQHHLGEIVTRHTRGLACFGAYVLNLENNHIETILSKFTIVAAGGVGNLYTTATNPTVATGDGIAMCHRAKALTSNMEFIQFHPTSLYNPSEKPSFLITEAMRGFGAILKLQNGEEFMDRYHAMGSLAPRDVVARSIDYEMKRRGEEFVYLDIRHRGAEAREHFPNIYNKCLSLGIDIERDMIPVTPAAHYCCGGVSVDKSAQSSIKRLFVIGESACTGLHGANRLASNSLTEGLVYAHNAAERCEELFDTTTIQEGIPDWNFEGTAAAEEMVLVTQNRIELQQIMFNYVGIVRSNLRLERAMKRLTVIWQEAEELYNKTTPNRETCELRNMIAVAYLTIKQGQERRESVGLHYTIDYPPKAN